MNDGVYSKDCCNEAMLMKRKAIGLFCIYYYLLNGLSKMTLG